VGKLETDQLEDLSVDRMITLKFIFKKIGWKGVKWINLAQDR
jgi:hypothetical protein